MATSFLNPQDGEGWYANKASALLLNLIGNVSYKNNCVNKKMANHVLT